MTTSSSIPGAGLSYADLLDTPHGSEARTMWIAMGRLARVLGLSDFAAFAAFPRTMTIDECVAAITEVLPERYDIVAAAHAAAQLIPEVPKVTYTYEIREMVVRAAGEAKWVLTEVFDDLAEATTALVQFREALNSVFVLVEVQTGERTTVVE